MHDFDLTDYDSDDLYGMDYDDDYYIQECQDNMVDKQLTDEIKEYNEEMATPSPENIFTKIIGSNNPADLLGAALSISEELAEEQHTKVQNKQEMIPISGKAQKELMNRDFSKIRKNMSPFEAYVDAHIHGEEQQYLKVIYNSLNTLYIEIFAASIPDFYGYLHSRNIISSRPETLSFKHLQGLKNVADIALSIDEYNFDLLIKHIIYVKKINLNESLAK